MIIKNRPYNVQVKEKIVQTHFFLFIREVVMTVPRSTCRYHRSSSSILPRRLDHLTVTSDIASSALNHKHSQTISCHRRSIISWYWDDSLCSCKQCVETNTKISLRVIHRFFTLSRAVNLSFLCFSTDCIMTSAQAQGRSIFLTFLTFKCRFLN